MWKAAKATETKAALNQEQASVEVSTQQASLRMAEQALYKAEKEGEKKLAEAVKKASQSKAIAKMQIEKAEAAVAGRCRVKWDAIAKKKNKKLQKCKVLKSDLAMEVAK